VCDVCGVSSALYDQVRLLVYVDHRHISLSLVVVVVVHLLPSLLTFSLFSLVVVFCEPRAQNDFQTTKSNCFYRDAILFLYPFFVHPTIEIYSLHKRWVYGNHTEEGLRGVRRLMGTSAVTAVMPAQCCDSNDDLGYGWYWILDVWKELKRNAGRVRTKYLICGEMREELKHGIVMAKTSQAAKSKKVRVNDYR